MVSRRSGGGGRGDGAVRQHADLDERHVRRRKPRHVAREQVRGQVPPHRGDLAADLLLLLVDVYARLELDPRDRDALGDGRAQLLDVIEGVEALLDTIGDELFDVGGRRAGVDGDGDEARDWELRVLRPRSTYDA